MFNKKKCANCIYKGGAVDNEYTMFCNYAFIADQTCLHRVGKEIVDRGGTDSEHCLLYTERGGKNEKNENGENQSISDY